MKYALISDIHGTPVLNTVYWTEDRSDAFCLQMARQLGAKAGDVVAFGHTHKLWHRVVDGIHFLNTGSVSRPKDGDWRAGYVLLEMDGEAFAEFHGQALRDAREDAEPLVREHAAWARERSVR